MIVRMAEAATLLLLAGGESRRMGRPKALLPVGETTLIEWMARRLAFRFERLLVSAGDERQLPVSLRPHLVRDQRPGAGPLAGIESGLATTTHGVLVAVACDMPGVGVELTQRLLAASEGHDAAVPRVGGRPEPTCAAYRRSAAGPITAVLDAGRRRAAEALAELDVSWLEDEPAGQFADLDTPEDYAAFLDALRKKR
jgi:molybdenum cofactor guanylyltransferase